MQYGSYIQSALCKLTMTSTDISGEDMGKSFVLFVPGIW